MTICLDDVRKLRQLEKADTECDHMISKRVVAPVNHVASGMWERAATPEPGPQRARSSPPTHKRNDIQEQPSERTSQKTCKALHSDTGATLKQLQRKEAAWDLMVSKDSITTA